MIKRSHSLRHACGTRSLRRAESKAPITFRGLGLTLGNCGSSSGKPNLQCFTFLKQGKPSHGRIWCQLMDIFLMSFGNYLGKPMGNDVKLVGMLFFLHQFAVSQDIYNQGKASHSQLLSYVLCHDINGNLWAFSLKWWVIYRSQKPVLHIWRLQRRWRNWLLNFAWSMNLWRTDGDSQWTVELRDIAVEKNGGGAIRLIGTLHGESSNDFGWYIKICVCKTCWQPKKCHIMPFQVGHVLAHG